MLFILQKSLVLLLCLSVALATNCPVDVEASRFVSITGDSQTFNSDFYDAFYEIKVNSVDSEYILTGYKITEVDNVANTGFDAEEFTLKAGANWKILAVSQLGNCVLIDNRPNLMAFDTSEASFNLVQNLTQANFVSGKVNDDCTIVRLALEDETQKVLIDESENTQIAFPAGSLFDAYFIYGIDSTGALKKVSEDSMTTVDIEALGLKSTPVSVMNRKDLNSLILVTSNEGKTEFAISVVNTFSDAKAYLKEWASDSFTGDFKVELSMEGSFIVVRDDNGYLVLLQISYSETETPEVSVTEVTLENSEYNSLFSPESVISMTENAVVVYLNGKLTYFQPYEGELYYLAQIVEDLELEAIKFANESSTKDLTFTTTYFYADEVGTCDVFPEDPTDPTDPTDPEEIDESEMNIEEQEEVVDEKGNFIRCSPECLACNSKGQCKVCALGFSLDADGECVLCDGCKSCNPKKPAQCTSCFKPEVLNPTTKTCQAPTCQDDSCLDCNFNGKCLDCDIGYSPFQGDCVKCQDGCDSCKNGGPDTCDDAQLCKQGFVYFPTPSKSIKYSCVECAAGCLGCQTSDLSNCTQCNDGYFTNFDEDTNKLTCTSCFSDCITCTDAKTCSKCDIGFRLNSDKTKCIEKCDESCLTCSQTNVTECKTCYLGSKLVDTQCVADLSCNTDKSCVSCALGYVLKDKQCIQCTTGIANCISCSSSNTNTCTRCATGFYINDNRDCSKCPSECATCQNEAACLTCTEGYYLARPLLSATGKCLACRSTCKTCLRNPFLCTSCRTGFTLEGNKCIDENRVEYSVTVSADVSLVVVIARTFLSLLIEIAEKASVNPNKPLKLTSDDITLEDIKKGSAILEGAMSAGDASQSTALASSLNNQLNGKQLQSGFSILSAQVKAVVPKTSSSQSGTSLGLILGVAIPICIIVVIGAILIVYKLRKRKEDLDSDKNSSNSGYFVNESQKYVAKYSEESDKI